MRHPRSKSANPHPIARGNRRSTASTAAPIPTPTAKASKSGP